LVNPSIAVYWHIGETTILFFMLIFFMIKDENSFDIMKKCFYALLFAKVTFKTVFNLTWMFNE